MRYLLLVASILSLAPLSLCSPAMAQSGRGDNPNMRNFYMARQQVQIFDDAPQVNDMRTQPGQPGTQAPQVSQPQALPKASFNTYMSGLAGGGGGQGLPQVNNGVPKNLPSAGPNLNGQRAQSGGTVKAQKRPAAPKAPVVAKAYRPYATTPVNTGSSGSMLNSSTSVQGSVLHWNKRRTGY